MLIEIRKMESGLTKETKDTKSLVWSKVNEGSHEIMSGHSKWTFGDSFGGEWVDVRCMANRNWLSAATTHLRKMPTLTFSFCGYLLVQHRDALPDTMTPIPHPGSDFP